MEGLSQVLPLCLWFQRRRSFWRGELFPAYLFHMLLCWGLGPVPTPRRNRSLYLEGLRGEQDQEGTHQLFPQGRLQLGQPTSAALSFIPLDSRPRIQAKCLLVPFLGAWTFTDFIFLFFVLSLQPDRSLFVVPEPNRAPRTKRRINIVDNFTEKTILCLVNGAEFFSELALFL